MPKLFPIHIEVEELAVGRVMRLLNNMPGVAKFGLDMDRNKRGPNGAGEPRGPYKRRKQSGQFTETGDEAIANALHGKPPMTAQQLADVFALQGRSRKSVSSIIHKMKKAGLLQSGDQGYSLTTKMRDRMRHRKARQAK